jgi:hypothetical protein
MNLGEIITLIGYRLDDIKVPYLWEDGELIQFINDAQNQVCEECGVLRDSSTAAICNVSITAGTSIYSIDSRVVKIFTVKLGSSYQLLEQTTRENLNNDYPGWESQTGTPTTWIQDNTGKITLYPKPTANSTLYLYVSRYPLTQLANREDTPEIPWKYHPLLINGAIAQAYMKGDTETESMNRMASFLKLWQSNLERINQSEINYYYQPLVASPPYGTI